MLKQAFDRDWEYTEATGMFAAMFAQWQPVTLPHDASIAKPRNAQYPTGSSGGFAWSGTITYRKQLQVPSDWEGKAVQLEFEGVYLNAEVSVNGHLAALHPYGYTSFLVDLTPYLIYGAENEVSVVANNSAQPNSRWYSGTGIYRHVWLRLGGEVHIPPWGVFVSTPIVDRSASQVSVDTRVSNSSDTPADVVLRSTVLDTSGKPVVQVDSPLQVGAMSTIHASQKLTIPQAELWSVEAPSLYALTSQVLMGTEVMDTETTVFGIRSITVNAQNGFRLNGMPMKLKGGCVHHDNGLLGAASYDRAEERKVELMKSAGFNAIRCAHNPPAPAMLDACDRLGMLVIDETFDCWRMGKTANDYHLYFEDWWQRDTEAMVRRDRNHPSVIMWSIGNEVGERSGVSDGYAWCRKQADLVRALDGTRFVTSALPALFDDMTSLPGEEDMERIFELLNSAPTDPQQDSWGARTLAFIDPLDVAGYNYLSNRYELDGETFPDRVICGTETWPHWAYAFWDATSKLPHVIGDFVWTAIDYLGEAGIGRVRVDEPMTFFASYPYHLANCGDFDICGFKRPQSYYRDILWDMRKEPYIAVLDPGLHGAKIGFSPWGWEPVLDSWTFPGREGKPTTVHVYCADDEVELLINGVSAGRKPTDAAQHNTATFDVTYVPGTVTAIGYTGGKEGARTSLATAGEPAALRLTPDRAALDCQYGDLAYVTVEVVDRKGVVVPYAEQEVSFEVSGAGDLAALGTANPVSEEMYVGTRRKAFQGRLMAVVRSTGQAGEVRLEASADELGSGEVSLRAG